VINRADCEFEAHVPFARKAAQIEGLKAGREPHLAVLACASPRSALLF
jgi:hypothetical protein